MKYEVELTDEEARKFLALDREHIWTDRACQALADAVRANPPKPPRMDEPGWGQRVVANTRDDVRRIWLHFRIYRGCGDIATNQWRTVHGDLAAWDDLINPEPWRADS